MTECAEPLYYAKDGKVWKRPIRKDKGDGRTSLTVGFPICKMLDYVGDDAAETVAHLMNLGQTVADAKVAS